MYLPVKQIGNPDSSISQPLFFWCTLTIIIIINWSGQLQKQWLVRVISADHCQQSTQVIRKYKVHFDDSLSRNMKVHKALLGTVTMTLYPSTSSDISWWYFFIGWFSKSSSPLPYSTTGIVSSEQSHQCRNLYHFHIAQQPCTYNHSRLPDKPQQRFLIVSIYCYLIACTYNYIASENTHLSFLILIPVKKYISISVISTRGQSNLTKSASWGAHSPVRGHPRGSKVVPLNSWGRVSY